MSIARLLLLFRNGDVRRDYEKYGKLVKKIGARID